MGRGQGFFFSVPAQGGVTLLRGRRDGLEVTLPEHDLEQAFVQLEARLAQQPGFYNGSHAVANFGNACPTRDSVARLRALLGEAGITLSALAGAADGLEELATDASLAFESRARIKLSDSASSLIADFAGARGDIAQRRRRGEASVPRLRIDSKDSRQASLRLVETPTATLYHAATLRGGQVLHHTGNIVVVGDVNPGAELVATGDIVVFGRLGGIAHAGAGGELQSRIYAVELLATQLRIATCIATEPEPARRLATSPEVAFVRDGKIGIVPLRRLAELVAANVPS